MNKKLLKKEFNSFFYFFNKELEEKKISSKDVLSFS
jgi:hypothetical protein